MAAAAGPAVPSTEQLVVEVFVRDVVVSTRFYRALGFQVVRETPGFVEFAWENHLLFLDEREGLRATPVPDFPAANVRIMVHDVDAVYTAVKAALGSQWRVFADIADRYYGLRDFTLLDPDGFGIRFGAELPAARLH